MAFLWKKCIICWDNLLTKLEYLGKEIRSSLVPAVGIQDKPQQVIPESSPDDPVPGIVKQEGMGFWGPNFVQLLPEFTLI
jgi:hypothetical protein